MLRGTRVRLNNKVKPLHLVGDEGFAFSRSKKTGYIEVLFYDKDVDWVSLWFSEDTLDIIEPPIELGKG